MRSNLSLWADYGTTTKYWPSIFVSNTTTLPTINVSFLKKERVYTKLKYSRTPQYDIISGGFAALLAGFFGFLICEKFGFEMVDSGDFFILILYIAIVVLAGRAYIAGAALNVQTW